MLSCAKIGSLLFRKLQGVVVIESFSKHPENLNSADGVRAKSFSEARSYVPPYLVSVRQVQQVVTRTTPKIKSAKPFDLVDPLFALAEESLLVSFEL